MKRGSFPDAEICSTQIRRQKFCIVTELRTGEQGRRQESKELNFMGTLPMDNRKVMFSMKFITSFSPLLQCF